MSAPAALLLGSLALLALAVVCYRIREYRRHARRFMPPRDWPRPFDYSTLAPPRKLARPPRFTWPHGGAK
jgi:hypothetical protein